MRPILLFLLLASCSSQFATRSEDTASRPLLEEVRIALMDLRNQTNGQKVDLSLLEERLNKLERSMASSSAQDHLKQEIADLRQKISILESRVASDMQGLSTQTHQQLTHLERQVEEQEGRLDEISKLRQTLTSISKAMNKPNSDNLKTHRVRPGESLEKIARQHQTSIDEIKRLNGLSGTKIIIGQELKLPESAN